MIQYILILTFKSKSSYNHRPNFLEFDIESLMIQFREPNCLSLVSVYSFIINSFLFTVNRLGTQCPLADKITTLSI